MAAIPFSDVLKVESLGEDRFTVTSVGERDFLFGGLSMAVAVRGAAATVDSGKLPLSVHATFLAGGRWQGPHHLAVQRVSETRAFALRRVELVNSGRLAVVADVMFHNPEEGDDWSRVDPPRSPPPDEGARLYPGTFPVDLVDVVDEQLLAARLGRVHPFWCRMPTVADDPVEQACALAFLSDWWIISSPFDPGQPWMDRYMSRTLDHSLWFHRPVSEPWWHVDCCPLSLTSGRYVSRGSIQQADGTLLASFSQMGFVRSVQETKRP
jgi:acyl-CoA thioesterase